MPEQSFCLASALALTLYDGFLYDHHTSLPRPVESCQLDPRCRACGTQYRNATPSVTGRCSDTLKGVVWRLPAR